MNAINLYINACRLVMQAEVESKEFCMEVYKLLPTLRQSLSCTVCGKLLSEPYTPTETLCQHHVCKNCIGNKKRLKPSCSWCKDYETYVENSQIKLVIQCFIKLCSFMEKTGIIQNVSRQLTNGGYCSIREIVDEVISNGEDICREKEIDQHSIAAIDNVVFQVNGIPSEDSDVNSDEERLQNLFPSEIKDEEELDVYVDCINDVCPEINVEQENDLLEEAIDSPITFDTSPKIDSSIAANSPGYDYSDIVQTPPSKSTNIITNSIPQKTIQLNSNHINNVRLSTNLYDNKVNSNNLSIKMVPNSIHNIKSNIDISQESINNIRKIDTKINLHNQNIKPSTSSLLPGYTIPSNIKQIGIYNSILDPGHQQPTSQISHINSVPQTTVSCVFNIPAGAIFSSNTKQTSIGSNAKVTMPSTNSSYSVMYCDSDNTKITFKRKPPDIENINSSDKFKFPESDINKRIRPKPKQKPKRKGCRCGNATPTPGKLTCCGQRCPCYVAAKACIECQCRGCRNPHRPGGKKVRPIIPQFENIKIHQIQQVHPHSSTVTSQYQTNTFNSNTSASVYNASGTSVCGVIPTTIRTLHAMPGIGPIHTVSGGMHHLINIGSRIVDSSMAANINLQQNQELAMKQINLNMPSIPTQFIINDDRLSSQSSDISDIDIDVK